METGERLFLGIDVGTGGVRAMAVTETGNVAAVASVAFEPETPVPQQGGHEQQPEAWWRAVCQTTAAVADQLSRKCQSVQQWLAAVAVDGTSGTLVALNRAGEPLRPALMYNDSRAGEEAAALNDAAGDFCDKLGYRFNASFALAKIAWLRRHEPAIFDAAARFVHQADYVVERLTGQPAVSDYSNALKTGYDLVDERWPAWIDQHLGVVSRLPSVVAPGTPIGTVSSKAAAETGLPGGLRVIAGASDGTAAFLASGARRVGDYNTTLGTTLVFKGISSQICRHPQGVIYCHKLPGGWWLPGAASNVGTDWIGAMFPGGDLAAMDAAAAERLPSQSVAYPLVRCGERFPFLARAARGFFVPELPDAADRYAACLQGVALVERLGYQVLDAAGAVCDGADQLPAVGGDSRRRLSEDSRKIGDGSRLLQPDFEKRIGRAWAGEVYATGGGSRSDVWMQCRADATGRVIHRPACGESAFGAAVLSAAGAHYNSIIEAVGRMVRLERTIAPDQRHVEVYDRVFGLFCSELRKRGYL
jgi:D-ribulokinase